MTILGTSAEKIVVSLLGVSALPPAATVDVKTKYHITKPYALYVGVAYPHKNLSGLIKAWDIFVKKYGNDYQLVLGGKFNYFYHQLQNDPLTKKLGDSIILTDFIPDADLGPLYQNAALYVFPSLYEGFGLPPLEAMVYQLPVASSNLTCLPEILQDAAAYFDPKNYPQMADVIHRAFTDQNLRSRLIAAGQKVIHNYSWQNTAKITWDIYAKGV
jgi:glycosyltransferase involved in cell wall biosynthesis